MKQKKALIVACSELSNFDGKSLRLIKYAEVLVDLGYKVDFFVLRNNLTDIRFSIYEKNIDVSDFFGNVNYKPLVSEFINSAKLTIFGFSVLNRIMSNKYDVVITSAVSPEFGQFFAILGCKIKKIKHIYDYDDLAPEMSIVMKGWKTSHPLFKTQLIFEKLICSNSFKTIAMSDLMKEKISTRSTTFSEVEVIYNAPFYNDVAIQPIEDARVKLGINKQKFIFCYVGNIQRKVRSLEVLVDAVEIAAKKHSNFQVLMVGSGSGSPLLQEYICEKGLADYFLFTGPINKNEVINYTNASNVSLVLLPNSLLGDYMAPGKLFVSMGLGKNVIATSTSQVVRILGEEAIYVNPNPTPIELANALKLAITKYSLTELNHTYIDLFNKHYNWDVEKNKFISILSSF